MKHKIKQVNNESIGVDKKKKKTNLLVQQA